MWCTIVLKYQHCLWTFTETSSWHLELHYIPRFCVAHHFLEEVGITDSLRHSLWIYQPRFRKQSVSVGFLPRMHLCDGDNPRVVKTNCALMWITWFYKGDDQCIQMSSVIRKVGTLAFKTAIGMKYVHYNFVKSWNWPHVSCFLFTKGKKPSSFVLYLGDGKQMNEECFLINLASFLIEPGHRKTKTGVS